MANRTFGGSSRGSWKQGEQTRTKRKRAAKRGLLLEKLEERTLLTVVGPRLSGIQPTDGELLPLDGSGIRNIAPRDLTFRFDENQQIDPNTLGGIRIIRSGLDGDFSNGFVEVTPGYIGVGEAPDLNQVIVRFQENLPDDLYRIELYGIDDTLQQISALRNTRGEAFGDLTDDGVDNGTNLVVGFKLELAPQVLAVVPQPLMRVPDPANPANSILQQARDQIVVYFNDDDLFVEDDATGKPTQRSAENPSFYRLIYTWDTVENTDDITFFPAAVDYNPATDSATLTFAGDLDTLPIPAGHPNAGNPIGPGTWRLRVGTDEALPLPPLTRQPTIQSTTDFGTGGAVSVSFNATGDFGKAVALSFSEASLGIGVGPEIAVAGNAIQVVLNTDGSGTTADALAAALNADPAARKLIATSVRGVGTTPVIGSGVRSLRVVGLGSSFDTAYDLGQLGTQSLLIPSTIDPQPFALDLPGGHDEPGHRDIPTEVGSGFEQHINPNFGADVQDGVTTIPYNFRQVYGYDAQGNALSNLITEKQKTRVREAVETWAKYIGVQFLETAGQGLTFVTGDPRALDPNDPNVLNHALNVAAGDDYDFIVRIDPTYANGMIILDSARQWNSDFGGDWFQRVMVGLGAMLGLQRANDLPVTNLMAFDSAEPFVNFSGDGFGSAATSFFGSRPSEPVFPGNADIIHGQYIHRPDSNDIDLYRFTIDLNDQQLDEKKKGVFTAESFAERLANSSELDTVLSLYREVAIRDENGAVIGYERELISRNDNYYSSDSYISLELASGTYYLAVTASGNTDFDPVIEDTGYGGTTQGKYELRLNFRSQVDDDNTISDLDRSDENRPGTRLDGDADGVPGGVFNFWFQTRPLDRVLRVTGDGNTYVDGQTVTIEDAFGNVRRFEFDRNGSLLNPSATRIPFTTGIVPTTAIDMANQLYNAINSSGLAVTATQNGTAITLKEERVTLLSSTTVGVELAGKTIFVDKTSGTNLRGTLAKPFDSIATAFGAAAPGDIVRIVGNGGFDGDRATLGDNFAYEIGFGASGGPATLPDGSSMSVPHGVTAMIDAGAVFKLRRARIGVGSSSASVDRSGGALQVLGTPRESVYFTSWLDESMGRDTYPPTTTPSSGDWGGILFKADLDNADARFNYEREGIFLNYISHADIRYGGGQVRIDTVDQVVNPIQMIDMRPTIAFNRITYSADAAMSADPDSFEETNFLAPAYQLVNQFTPDYERIGPEIHGNVLLQNSINGLFVRIDTPAGTELRSLTVSARFDDTDIVHVLAENLKIQGKAGGALLEQSRPPVDLVTLAARVGGSLTAGSYTYKLVFVDENGFEGRPSEATASVTLTSGNGTVQLNSLPPVSGNFVSRRLYRSQSGGAGPYNLIAQLDATHTTYTDRGVVPPSLTLSLLNGDPPSVRSVSLVQQEVAPALPGLAPGSYTYRVVNVDDATGETSPASDATVAVTVTAPSAPLNVRVVALAGLPAAEAGHTQRIYRSSVGGGGTYVLVGEIPSGVTVFTDGGTDFVDADGELVTLDLRLTGVVRARPDGRLKIDPGTVVKLEGARIEITFGAQLIAEGLDGKEVIFTSKLDDRYGAGGTFDTNKDDGPNEARPSAGDWGGIYAGYLSHLSLDHAYIAFGGGNDNKIEGTFKGFNVIEVHQAEARIANSVIEYNAPGTGGQGSAYRYGRGINDGATMFIRGARPVIINNVIRNNQDVAVSINLDSFTGELVSDPGRTTGAIDRLTLYQDNRGPLVRGNRLANNGNQYDSNGNLIPDNNGNVLASWVGTNGMEIRTAAISNNGTAVDTTDDYLRTVGITLSTESVWDDTDIVHILYDEVRVSNLHVYGGLRLRSSPNESLVVKMYGAGAVNDTYNQNPTLGAGFTATGQLLETEDRIGGSVYVLGQPGFPVVLTSIHDDTVGAGVQPDGRAQTDTNNNGIRSTPQAGDWRSLRLDQNSNDRNVEIVLELEAPEATAPGLNGIPARAQFLGALAPGEYGGDDNLRLGFEIDGFLNARNDIDYYSFTAAAGTEIWFDVDRSRYGLDTVVELLDANGVVIARSDNSQDETGDRGLLYQTDAIPSGDVNPLQKLNDSYQPHHASGLPKDIWGTNPLDAGMRVVLPGAQGERSSYLFRIRSSNLAAGDDAAQLQDPNRIGGGLTSGVYRFQVRMRELDEVPGSTVRYADIRYAQNGVELIGLPGHSPLLGEAAEDEGVDAAAASNNSFGIAPGTPGSRPQELGNLFQSDQATLSVAGSLSSSLDVDFYTFDVRYDAISNPSAAHGSLVLDLDYADGLNRANTTVTVFNSSGVPILIARDSNIAEDRPAPVVDPLDQSGMYDLSRGTVGEFDPFLGPVELPQGRYYVAVTSDRMLPSVLNDRLNNPEVRLEPVNSVIRIAEDRIGSYGGSTAVSPVVPVLLDPTFDGTTLSPTNLWHVSNLEATTSGHGLTAAFDGSRVNAPSAGRVTEQEPNDTLPSAQSLEGYIWSLNSHPDIGDAFGNTSTVYPHLTITATGNESFDYYSFVVSSTPARGIFDIDYGATGSPLTDLDSQIFLYDSAGNLLDSNNDAAVALGAGGSTSTLDSFLAYTFDRPGTYIIGVAASPSNGMPGGIVGTPVGAGDTYTLQVSIENHAAVTTAAQGGSTFYFGREATGSYGLGGGSVANGSLVSNAFSLKNFSAQDLPVLYFNYRLNADTGDYFRAYVQRRGGTEQLVASSNPVDVTGAVIELTNDDVWRQARVSLATFAGQDLLKLRFEFRAADATVPAWLTGVHIDDVIIGFAERGEMITEAPANATFGSRPNYNTTGRVLTGQYQLEMRRATDYGTSVEARLGFGSFTVPALILNEAYDTNDRQAQQMTIVVPAGSSLGDGQTFRLGDGSGDLTFEFDLVTDGVIQPGNVRVPFRATDADYVVAAAIRDAINSSSVQSQLDLQAALSDGAKQGSGGRSNRIDLFGNAVGDDFAIQPASRVLRVEKSGATNATVFGNLLRDKILGTGFTPTAGATFVGGVDATDGTFASAGLFTGGLSSIGMESGIVLATGKATVAGGPNTSNASSGDASRTGDADLDNEFFPLEPAARKTKDATSLQFPLRADFSGTAYFNFVFASEEYNELVGTSSQADVLAVFVRDLTAGGPARNVALIPGTTTPVSRATVNGGNPFGAGGTNPLLYNNNDMREGGAYLREFGYDGFTDVFTAQFSVVAGHEYQIKFAIADAGDRLVDSAVFIEAGTLGNVNPAPAPVGLVAILHDGSGDSNHFRQQGQMLIHSNTITNSADFGIVADAGERDVDPNENLPLAQPHMGPVRNLLEPNNYASTGAQGGFAPGATIVNNTIYGEGLGGIHFSGNLRPYELIPRDNAGGDLVCDGDAFAVTVGRTTVEFEFEDLSNHSEQGACPSNPSHGDGWTPGRVPIYYAMVSDTAGPYPASTQQQLARAIADAITESILVTNGTTLVAEANVASARRLGGAAGFGSFDAAYVDHARDVEVLAGDRNHNPFASARVVAISQAAQPFGRIVNNTIVGNDGNASFFPDDPAVEPNDTIFNAIDTRQGRQASPDVYRANNVTLGDAVTFPQNPEWDVDVYQFQMDVGDQVQISVTGNEFTPVLRLFNARGEEFVDDGSRTARGAPRYTVNGNQVTIEFYIAEPPTARAGYNYAREGGTYFVAVSGPGNTTYSPLSLGGRQSPTDQGTYDIRVDVLAPRTWVIDTQPLFGSSATWEFTDVDGNTETRTYNGTSDNRANTAVMAYEVKQLINSLVRSRLLSGVSAEDYGGPEYVDGIGLTPYPSNPRRQWPQQHQGEGRRYVVIRGAAKVVQLSGPANVLSPTVGQSNTGNNVDSQLLRETGILISEEATPTLLNNVISNTRNAVIETENQPSSHQATGPSPRTAVVGAQIFQHSASINGSQAAAQMGNWRVSTGSTPYPGSMINPEEQTTARADTADFNLPLSNTAPLFVNGADGNFFPATLAASIDSSVDSLEDRPAFITIKAAMGISNSPILAPERDATGQLRIDDPNVSTPQGQGGNVFKDRGSLDRSDFVGPAAVLLNPRDNDAEGNDIDPTDTVVQLTGGSYDSFLIQIVDGFESADPYPGVGVNDATVLGPNGPESRLPGAAVTVFADGVFLEEGIDYTFRYDATSNIIRLSPTSGVWEDDKVYIIRLNNRDRYVINAPDGTQARDGDKFRITADDGVSVTFEYDSGYTIQVPYSLAIQVPAGGVADGQRFVVRNANDPGNPAATFELDLNGYTLPDSIAVPFELGDTPSQIADAIVAALTGVDAQAAELQLAAKNAGGGLVHLGAPERYTLNTELSSLSQPATIMSLAVPAVSAFDLSADVYDGQTFTITHTSAAGPSTTVTFEFDTDAIPNVVPPNTPIPVSIGALPDQVADEIVTVLSASPLAGLLAGLQHVGGGLIHIHEGDEVSIDSGSSKLLDGYVSRPLPDDPVNPQVFVVSFDDDADAATPPIQASFELDREGTTQPGNVVIPFDYGDTHQEIGQKIAQAVAMQLPLELTGSKHLENGVVFFGGTVRHEVDLSNSPGLVLLSRPDVTPATRLILPAPLTITVDPQGGAAILDGEYFQITDTSLPPANQVFQFEFNSVGGADNPNTNQLIPFGVLDTADMIAQAIVDAIEASGLVLQPIAMPGGIVTLTGANSSHSLTTVNAPHLTQSGGRLADGETFSITFNGVTRTFEYDVNGRLTSSANLPILFRPDSTNDQIGASTVAAIKSQPLLNLPNVRYAMGQGIIEFNDTSRHITVLPADAIPPDNSLRLDGIPGGAARLPFEPWSQFTGLMFADLIVDAINASPLTNVTASLRGGNTLFVDFLTAANKPVDFVSGLANITGISNYFLRAIQDLPGNFLKLNQYTGETRFTILLPGADLDFGDARVANRPSQYPTLFEEDGARHVVTPGWYLGNRVDGELQAQIVPAGFGDDLDHLVDLRDSTLELAGSAPLTVQLPNVANPDTALDTRYFDLTANAATTRFVFDRGRDGTFDPLRDDTGVAAVRAVEYDAGATLPRIAEALVAAVETANLGLHPVHLGAGAVFLGGTQLHQIESTSAYVAVAGQPTYQITAAAGYQIQDGETLTISDGQDVVPWVFEFDLDGTVAAGNFIISILPGDDAVAVAQKIAAAVSAAERLRYPLPVPPAPLEYYSPAVDLTELGDGALHVRGALSHEIAFQNSTMTYGGQTPLTLTVPPAGLGFRLTPGLTILVRRTAGGGVADGQTFTLGDAVKTVVFEFETGAGLTHPGARPVAVNALSSAAEVAESIRAAVQLAVDEGAISGLAPAVDASTDPTYVLIDLRAGIEHRLDASASGLLQRTAVRDGQTFQVNDGSSTVIFEFDFNGTAGGVPVPVQLSFSANDIANAMVAAVQQSLADPGGLSDSAGLVPKNLGAGNVQIGGPGWVAPGSTPALGSFGSAGGVLDGHTFHLIDSLGVRRFEFDANGQAIQGNITIPFQVTSTASEIAASTVAAIRASGYGVNVVHLGGGVIAMDGDDEDGVRFDRVLTPGATVPVTVIASQDGYLDGWLDLNGDGDWNDQYEQVFKKVAVRAGANQLTIWIPPATGPGVTYARFRFGSEGGLAPTGLAIDGEVEDYRVEIISNDPPAIVAPNQLSTQEDLRLPVSGLQIADPDAAGATIEVTLSVIHGQLDVPTIYLPGGIAGNSSNRVVLTGTLAQVNSTLAGLTYLNAPDYNGTDRLTIVADDRGNSGTGGPQQDVKLVPISIVAMNDPPVINVPGTLAATEDETLAIAGITVADVDLDKTPSTGAGSGQITVLITAERGTLDVDESAAVGVTVTGDRTSAVTLQGDLVGVNAILAAGVDYLGLPDLNGNDVITVSADDLGNWPPPAQTASTSFTVAVAAVNDAPVITAPATVAADEDTELPLSGFNLVDVDSEATPVTVVLTVTGRNDGLFPNGVLTIKQVAGGVNPLTQVAGNGTSAVTVTAAVAEIAATLSDPNGWSYTPPPNFAGNTASPRFEILTVAADDGGASGSGGAKSDVRQVTVYVSEVNDPPVVTVPLAPAVVDEDGILNIRSLGKIEVTDADAGNAVISVQLSALRGTITVDTTVPGGPLITGNGTSLVGLSGTLTAINQLLDSFVNYQGLLNVNSTHGLEVLTILANDLGNTGGPAATGTGRITITVNPINDAPQISLPGTAPSVAEDTDLRIPAISISDPDVTEAGADGVITVTLTVSPIAPNTQAGTLTVNAAVVPSLTVTGSPGTNVEVRGPLADINTMLAHPNGLKYRGAENASGKVLFSITANDQGKSPATPAPPNGPKTTTATMTITVVPVNDAPVITVPASPQSAVEDQPRLIMGISLADVDLAETTSDPAGTGNGQLTVTLSAGRGTIDLSDIVPPGVTVANDGSQSVIVSGLLADVNTLLGAGITYQGLPYLNGNDTITVTANDLGNWPPPARVSTASFVVAVAPVNNPPVISAPGEQLVNEDSPHTFPSITVTDVDVADGTNQLKVDLRVSHGTLTLDLTVPGGLRPADVTGNGTSRITIDKVSPGKINATLSALSGLTYRPAVDYNGPDALTIVADDKGNTGGAVTPTTVAVPIAIAAVNDAPQLPWSAPPGVAPAPLTSEDMPVYIKWPANAVVDADASELPGDGKLMVTLSASHGTLTVSTSFGLRSGDFNGSNSGGTVEFTAPLAAINATLSAATGVQYAPNLNYNGKDTVVVTVNDRGNTDAGLMNPLTARGTVTVTVVAVNDPPVITVPATSVTVAEDTDLPLQVQVTDVDAAEGTGELQMTLQVFRGALTVDTAVSGGVGAGGVTGNGTTAVSLVGTQQQLNATFAAGGVVYRGNLNYFTTNPGDEILLIHARDEANGVDNKTVTITINPINDAPTININPPAQIIEDTPVALQIAVNDAEMNVPIGANVIWTLTLHADLGTFTVLPGVAGGVPAWGIAGSGSGHVVLTGTGRQIQTTLAAPNAVGFQGVKDFAGTDILSVTILDPGPTAAPDDDQISSATLTYTISGVNDAPEIALPAGLTTPEDVPLPLSGPQGVRVVDVDSGAANISVVLQVVNGKLTVGGSVPVGLNVAGSGTSKLTLVGPVAAIGTLLADPGGLKYTGNLNYFGSDTLVVSADDRGNSGEGGTKTATQSTAINVTPVNDPPVVAKPVADFSVDEDSPDTLIELFPGVFADPDNTSLTLTVTYNSDPSLVAATITGTRLTLDYQPNQGGRSSIIRVRASDGLAFAEDEFVVTVNPLPDPPFVANPVPDQIVQLGSTTTVTVNLSGVFDDYDLPNDVLTLSYNNSTDNTNPTLVTSGTLIGQTLTLQLAAGCFGRADITVRATDSTGKSASDTFGVIVNSRPTANHDTATTKEDVAVAISVLNNDRDVDGVIDPSTVTIVAGSGPANGRIVSIIGGIVTYEPNANFWGTDSFQYTVNDNDGFVSQPATVTITVQAVPDYQNPFLNADVNKSGAVSPIDALIAINYINGPTGGVLPPDPTPPATPQYYYDVNGDGKCDAADVLAIVNILNAAASAGGEGEAAETSVTSPAEPVLPAHAGLSAAWLAVPDYTLLSRAAGDADLAVSAIQRESSLAARRDEFVPAAAETPVDVNESGQDAWFHRIGSESSELIDAAWNAALDDFAEEVDGGFGEVLPADAVLSGFQAGTR